MRARTCSFVPRLKRFDLCTPLVEAPWSDPQFSCQLTNVFARPHPLHGHTLKSPGVSLSLHDASFPGNCAQFCVSLHGFTPQRTPFTVNGRSQAAGSCDEMEESCRQYASRRCASTGD